MTSPPQSDLLTSIEEGVTLSILTKDLPSFSKSCELLKENGLSLAARSWVMSCVDVGWTDGVKCLLALFPPETNQNAWGLGGAKYTPRSHTPVNPLTVASILGETEIIKLLSPYASNSEISHALFRAVPNNSPEPGLALLDALGTNDPLTADNISHLKSLTYQVANHHPDLLGKFGKKINPMTAFSEFNPVVFQDAESALFTAGEESIRLWDLIFDQVQPHHIEGFEALHQQMVKLFEDEEILPYAPIARARHSAKDIKKSLPEGRKSASASKM